MIKKVVKHIFHTRAKIAPNLFLSVEQFLSEFGIEKMHNHSGYAAFSALLRSYIPQKVRVLDLGCNKGFETSIIAKTNLVVGVDIYSTFVNVAKKRKIDARVMDFHRLDFLEEFDCVYSNNSLEHSPDPNKVIQGVFRALKTGGIFIIGMPLDGYNTATKDPAHFFRATEGDVVSLLRNNKFSIIHKEIINSKEMWDWENPPAANKMLICIAKKD